MSVEKETKSTITDVLSDDENDFIVSTEWMTFYFSKTDFNKSEVIKIANEAVLIMDDIRRYLNVNYTLAEAEGTVCYFDSTYCNEDGYARSYCFWNEREMYCISIESFVHEYVHMISENNADIVYHPSDVFKEGLAEYVSLNFFDTIASQNYTYFKMDSVSKNSNLSEHQMICDLLSENDLEYNAKNYNKAFVAIFNEKYDVSKINKNSDFYNYYVGHIFVDYCVNFLGDIDKFMSVYCDSVTVTDVYGKKLDELVVEAIRENNLMFY